jgi:hypothetical protein
MTPGPVEVRAKGKVSYAQRITGRAIRLLLGQTLGRSMLHQGIEPRPTHRCLKDWRRLAAVNLVSITSLAGDKYIDASTGEMVHQKTKKDSRILPTCNWQVQRGRPALATK